tara:strand:- start:12247 stop:12372 length:126 start_codon:yes stop_codon:yes gene_type:complete
MIDWQKKNLLRRLAYWTLIPGNDFDKPWANWMLDGDRRWDV